MKQTLQIFIYYFYLNLFIKPFLLKYILVNINLLNNYYFDGKKIFSSKISQNPEQTETKAIEIIANDLFYSFKIFLIKFIKKSNDLFCSKGILNLLNHF